MTLPEKILSPSGALAKTSRNVLEELSTGKIQKAITVAKSSGSEVVKDTATAITTSIGTAIGGPLGGALGLAAGKIVDFVGGLGTGPLKGFSHRRAAAAIASLIARGYSPEQIKKSKSLRAVVEMVANKNAEIATVQNDAMYTTMRTMDYDLAHLQYPEPERAPNGWNPVRGAWPPGFGKSQQAAIDLIKMVFGVSDPPFPAVAFEQEAGQLPVTTGALAGAVKTVGPSGPLNAAVSANFLPGDTPPATTGNGGNLLQKVPWWGWLLIAAAASKAAR